MNKIDVLAKLSPQMAQVLQKQEEMVKDAFVTGTVSLEEIRANYLQERKFWNEGGPGLAKIVNTTMETKNGPVALRLYYPNEQPKNPALLYIHGGGYILGNTNTHDRIMRNFCHESGWVVVGIDYSLSPESKYPTALNECKAALDLMRENADLWGIDKNRLAIGGDSAGANLSLATALSKRDSGEDISYIRALLLYYGGFGLQDSPAMRLLGGPWDGLRREDLLYYMNMYTSAPEDLESPYLNLFNADLSGNVPPCFIAGLELDPLIDDSVLLCTILKNNNLPHTYKVYPGVLHGFLHYSKMLDLALEAIQDGAAYLNQSK